LTFWPETRSSVGNPGSARSTTSSPSARFTLEERVSVGGNLLPVNETPIRRLVFVTGTDTGVGKTLLTALLLAHLRRRRVPALAIKPFCSGSRADAQLLHAVQDGELTLDQINPFFFAKPLAPFAAARELGHFIPLDDVLEHVRSIARRLPQADSSNRKGKIGAPVLLIEGAGGLLVPLGPAHFVLDLIRELRCEVVVVSCNKLGTLNHTLLTVQALLNACPHLVPSAAPQEKFTSKLWGRSGRKTKPRPEGGPAPARVVLMEQSRRDLSAASNPAVLSQFLRPIPLHALPYFGKNCSSQRAIEKIEKKFEKTLARILI
jgi:dethiobiotin synthase